MAIDNRLHEDLMILVNNTPSRLLDYRALARIAQRRAEGHRPDAENFLAESLKNRFDWMADDVEVRPTATFPRLPKQIKGREDDPHAERKDMLNCLILHALRQVNWLSFAKDILDGLDEMDAYIESSNVDR